MIKEVEQSTNSMVYDEAKLCVESISELTNGCFIFATNYVKGEKSKEFKRHKYS